MGIPDGVLLLAILDPPVIDPDLFAALHGVAQGGAAVPVLGRGHDEAVAGDVGADSALGEP